MESVIKDLRERQARARARSADAQATPFARAEKDLDEELIQAEREEKEQKEEEARKRASSVEPEKKKKSREDLEESERTERMARPLSEWLMTDIEYALRKEHIDTGFITYRISEEAEAIYKTAVKKSSQQDVDKFLRIVPQGQRMVEAGLSFQINSFGRSVNYNHEILVLTVMTFIRYQIVDWELACVFNNDLPYLYRDGQRISTVYPEYQDEIELLGKLTSGTEMVRYMNLQFHLGNEAIAALARFIKTQKNANYESIANSLPHVPLFTPKGRLAKGFPYSIHKMRARERKYKDLRQTYYDYNTKMFQGHLFDDALKRCNQYRNKEIHLCEDIGE